MIFAVAVLFAAAVATGVGASLQTINEWNLLRYDVPFNYPNADSYRPEVAVPTGIEIGNVAYNDNYYYNREAVGAINRQNKHKNSFKKIKHTTILYQSKN